MRIGIDISQLAHRDTGVANFLENLVENLISVDKENEYILFFSSLRNKPNDEFIKKVSSLGGKRVRIKTIYIPPTLIEYIWNKLHLFPVELFIGKIDIFLSSDWVQPPTNAKKATILYDLIVYKYPEETHNKWDFNLKRLMISPNIVASQKRRLKYVVGECDIIFCISQSTKKDAMRILKIPEHKLKVITPGLTL